MKAVVGPSVFSSKYPEFSAKFSKEHEHNPLEGWKSAPKKPAMKEIRGSLTGDVYKMPENDYDEFMRFVKANEALSEEYKDHGKKLLRNVRTPGDYVDYAFDEEINKKIRKEENKIVGQEAKEGHIKYLWYNPRFLLLKVKFWNDTVCVFFNVPVNVVTYLMNLAKNNTMEPGGRRGKARHALGVEFWNLVRIRGTKHGTRYPFIYTEDNNNEAKAPSKYIYTETFNEKLQKFQQSRVLRDDLGANRESDKKLTSAMKEEEKEIANKDIIYDYEDEDLVTFFENGPYDEYLSKATPAQRALLIRANTAYENMRDIGDIETLLRKTNMDFMSPRELHAQYD